MSLVAKNIHFSYQRQDVLKGLSFSLERGDYLAVLGTNGAGKSTLLKCLNKIISPQLGHISINGIDAKGLSGKEMAKQIGYVPQKHDYSRMTVFDAVLLGRKPYIEWDASQEDMEIAEEMITLLGLEEYAIRYTNELSGGELQKVVIARALAQQPEVLLMDEPTSNLDVKNQMEVLNIIKKIIDKQNISAMVTMHDLNLALRFANKFLLIKDGKNFAFGDLSILNEKNIKDVYGVHVAIKDYLGIPVIIPA